MQSGNLPITNNIGGTPKVEVVDTNTRDALEEVVKQLRISNTYNALGFDQEIKEQDLEN